jgi:isoleucyl-tRNA synthetase
VMLAANDQVYWMPAHLKSGRFGKWLEGARDWAVSRNRYWGNPLPIWRCETCNAMECIGSRAELEKKSGVRLIDLHKHFVDDVTWKCSCGGTMRRISEVLDCWFESGAMPYGQNHYPFEHKQWFDAHFPADFISESIDQTRGWFYTLTVLAAALFGKPAFRSVVVSGLILDAEGKKMSKSQRNYTDPMEVIGTYGADAMRLFLIDSAVMKGEDLRFSETGVKEMVKNVIIPLWNAYSFFITYANIDGITAGTPPAKPASLLDRWILSEAEHMVQDVTAQLELLDLQRAVDTFTAFLDLLTNWYIRRSRRRFWKSGDDKDKREAYATLHAALLKLCLVAAPFMPFLTDHIWRNLRPQGAADSIHLADWPVYDASRRDPALERVMAVTVRAVSMGRSLRTEYGLKVRQPLKALHLATRDPEERSILAGSEDIIREELNVKLVLFRDNEEDLVEYQAKANFRTLGKALGKAMKSAAGQIEKLGAAEIRRLIAGEKVTLDLEGGPFELGVDGVEVQRIEKEGLKVVNQGSLTVGLDPEMTEELIQEGLVRDLIRGIQNLRKEKGLAVTDRIILSLDSPAGVKAAVERFRDHLQSETLAVSVAWGPAADAVDVECGDGTVRVAIAKAAS